VDCSSQSLLSVPVADSTLVIRRRGVPSDMRASTVLSQLMGWKSTARQILRKAGVEVTRYEKPSGEPRPPKWSNEAIRDYLSDVEQPVVLDVGANRGQSVERFRELLPGCQLHSFEPSPTAFQQLQAAASPDVRLINAAVGSAAGSVTLLENKVSALTSVLPLGPSGLGTIERSTVVPMITLDDYCEEHQVTQVDLLKCDTQGYELEVLRGACRLIDARRVRLILVELNFMERYEGQARFDEVLSFALDRGFHLVSFFEIEWRSSSRAGWGDALLAADDHYPSALEILWPKSYKQT
jgi:FkbM family methyltransferase